MRRPQTTRAPNGSPSTRFATASTSATGSPIPNPRTGRNRRLRLKAGLPASRCGRRCRSGSVVAVESVLCPSVRRPCPRPWSVLPTLISRRPSLFLVISTPSAWSWWPCSSIRDWSRTSWRSCRPRISAVRHAGRSSLPPPRGAVHRPAATPSLQHRSRGTVMPAHRLTGRITRISAGQPDNRER